MLKKVLALALAGAMVFASAVMADPTGSITIKPSTSTPSVPLTGKTLKAYRILNATYSATGTLEGTGANKQAVSYTIPASMADFYNEYFAQEADATATPPIEAKTVAELASAADKTVDQYVADRIAALSAGDLKTFEYAALEYAKDASKGNLTAETGRLNGANYEFTGLEAGYYIIEDEGEQVPISALMLDTVTNANVEINLKAEDNTEKEILSADDLYNSKANELGIGRAVNYKVTQKIPDTTGYDYYYYMINDTLSAGLTFNPDTLVVKVGGVELTKGTDYYLYYNNEEDPNNAATLTILNGKTFIVAFDDVVADIADTSKTHFVKDAAVEITYTATVNSDAVVGINPNKNEVNIEYSNNPDKDGKGDYDINHPGIPLNDDNHPTGEGPKKYTDTYTTQITIIKTDGQTNTALSNVEFTLTGTSKDAVFNAEEVYEIDPAGNYWLLKDGTYTPQGPQTAPTTQETTGGAGWVKIDASAAAAAQADGIAVRTVGNEYYRPYVEATDSALTRYKIIEANAADYDSTTTKYSKVTKTSDEAEEYDVTRSGLTADNGYLSFSQLGAGDYRLSETGILEGYNGIRDIWFNVTCEVPDSADVIAGTETATWTIVPTSDSVGKVTFVPDTSAGTFKINLENNKGVELPSTGGIGTTLFYAGGAVLVLLAGVLLVSKRRIA